MSVGRNTNAGAKNQLQINALMPCQSHQSQECVSGRDLGEVSDVTWSYVYSLWMLRQTLEYTNFITYRRHSVAAAHMLQPGESREIFNELILQHETPGIPPSIGFPSGTSLLFNCCFSWSENRWGGGEHLCLSPGGASTFGCVLWLRKGFTQHQIRPAVGLAPASVGCRCNTRWMHLWIPHHNHSQCFS